MNTQIHNKAAHAQFLHDDAERTLERLYSKYNITPPCTVADAVRHFNSGGVVVVRTRGHTRLYAKLWSSVGHTAAALTKAIQESDSFNCVGVL